MEILSIVNVILLLAKGALAVSVKSPAAGEIVDDLQVAVSALERVHGKAVTLAGLEELRVEPKW